MTALETAETAVAGLSPTDLVRFREWFAEYDGDIWDEQIERDAADGKLTALADAALAEYREGKATPI